LDKAVGKSTTTTPEKKEAKEVNETSNEFISKSRSIYESLKHGKIEKELKV
jgi:hypothetical protein